MVGLIIVSLIWAFSFGLIKTHLSGLDANLTAFIRLLTSLIVFLPFLRFKALPRSVVLKLFMIGMIQYGVMYIAYIASYAYLQAYQVALFTIFTPLYVSVIDDLLHKKFHKKYFLAALLAVAGTAVLVLRNLNLEIALLGIGLLQISNISFAFGQVYYKKVMSGFAGIADYRVFAWLYLGGVAVSGVGAGFTVNWNQIAISSGQWLTLIYLGVIASGLCFYLWNSGARQTSCGTLAVMNNMKVPLAILASVIFFNESADWLRLTIGLIIFIAALWIGGFKPILAIKNNEKS